MFTRRGQYVYMQMIVEYAQHIVISTSRARQNPINQLRKVLILQSDLIHSMVAGHHHNDAFFGRRRIYKGTSDLAKVADLAESVRMR